MTTPDLHRPAMGRWRDREHRALTALLLRDGGVSQAEVDAAGPDGEELADDVTATVSVWNAFGLLAQDFDQDDEHVHRLLLVGFYLEPDDETGLRTWTLLDR